MTEREPDPGSHRRKASDRGQDSQTEDAAHAAVRRLKPERSLRLQKVLNADRPAEVGEVRAAAHADVLARIDELPRHGIAERRCPPAQKHW